jgi:hypothetical protein
VLELRGNPARILLEDVGERLHRMPAGEPALPSLERLMLMILTLLARPAFRCDNLS